MMTLSAVMAPAVYLDDGAVGADKCIRQNAYKAGKFAVDDDDIQALTRQALGHSDPVRPAPATRTSHFMFSLRSRRTAPGRLEPRRTAAAKIGLFGIVGAKDADV